MSSDRIFGLCIVAVALAYLASATQVQVGFLSDPVGSRTFPYIVGGISLLCGLIIAARPDPDPNWPIVQVLVRIGLAVAVMYGFAVLLKPLGFIIPAAVASGLLSYLIEPKLKTSLTAGLVLSVGLFLIFKYGLGLGLAPFGRLFAG